MSSPNVMNGNRSATAAALHEEGKRLLDLNQRLDINLLDNVVNVMYTGDAADRKVAENLLTQFKEDPNAWTRVDAILQYSRNQETKYFALQILETLIKTRWNALPTQQTAGIKSFIVDLIIKTSSDSATMEMERIYLTKLNMVLVQILKREWPKRWPTFISDIVGASRTNESLCQNNMTILKLLTEEVFDFSSGQLTQAKAKFLKDTMCLEFSQIFQLCLFVMESSENCNLILCTLETLLPFLNWIPVGYIFETKLIYELIGKFLIQPAFRNVTLKCLTEIAAIKQPIELPQHNEKLLEMFTKTMQILETMLPSTTYIREAYANGKDDEQKFIQNLSLFLCTFLREHFHLLEKPEQQASLNAAFHYLLLISDVEEVEIFKICLEYWNLLTKSLYEQRLGVQGGGQNNENLYTAVLSRLRYIIIGRMAKPEEVLVVENEQGEVVREFLKDTDSIQLYRNMRETLVYLTHLDYSDTEHIMTAKLQNQVNGREWSWRNLNTLCWAIGSISGAMVEDDERRFLVFVIKDLLGLCEQKRGKDNKAIIAANIMYVVGQYPRFLRAHWKFLKTVVNKLFEFMHETHDGVQDMACDTFIKIAQKCRRYFVMHQNGESGPFIDEILNSMTSIICDLQPQQVYTFYEAVGCMISAETYPEVREALIRKYMQFPNYAWDEIMKQAQKNVDVLQEIDACKQLGNILKTNTRACKALGHSYVIQLRTIYLDMLNVYKVMSCNIATAISANGEQVTKQPLIRAMRTVKKETLKLISGWISQSHEPAQQMVVMGFIPPLLDVILIDYKECTVPSAREPEVLSTMAIIVEKLNTHISHQIPGIFDAVFAVTLEMISENFEDYPEHRLNFYTMLLQIIKHNFDAIVAMHQSQFKLILDSIIWSIKHTMRNVADIGHQALMALLENMSNLARPEQMMEFYVLYSLDLLQHLFCVITDPSLTSGLVQQTTVLAHIFYVIESDKIKAQLNPAEQAAEQLTNRQYVHKYVKELLKSVYPHLTDAQVEITVKGFFDLDQDIPAFKDHLRDFLVQIREYSGADDSDLFLAEREQALQKHEEEKRRRQMQVPGIINPHDIPEEMQD